MLDKLRQGFNFIREKTGSATQINQDGQETNNLSEEEQAPEENDTKENNY